MSNNNDERILKLKEQIHKKKSALGKLKPEQPITYVVKTARRMGEYVTLAESELFILLLDLHTLRLSSDDLGYGDFEINGFRLSDWISDVKTKYDNLNVRSETKKLTAMEKKLTELLSGAKQTELELDDIANLLGGE